MPSDAWTGIKIHPSFTQSDCFVWESNFLIDQNLLIKSVTSKSNVPQAGLIEPCVNPWHEIQLSWAGSKTVICRWHKTFFKMVVIFFGFWSKSLQPVCFAPHLLGPSRCSDLESEDYEFYKGLEFLLKHHVSDLGYDQTFSTEVSAGGYHLFHATR